MAKPKVTAADVVTALREDYGLAASDLAMEEWALLTEVPLLTMEPVEGIASTYRRRNERTIDVLLCRNWGSGKPGFDRLAVEVKVSRSDYRNETDSKRAPAWANAHRCAYAVPVGLITPDELPDGWGLLYVHPEPVRDVAPHHPSYGKRVTWARKATRHEPTGDPIRLMHTLARRASRAEERIRRGGDSATEVAALREDVKRLHARLANRDAAIDRQRARANDALRRLRGLGEQRCADCEHVVKVAPPSARATYNTREDGFWSHADVEQGERCRMARSEAERTRREAETGSRYSGGYNYAPPVETVDERAERERESVERRAEDDAHDALVTDEDRREEWRHIA